MRSEISIFLLIILISIQISLSDVFASPIFGRQEISDPYVDWFDLNTQKSTESGGNTLSDIVLINYFSDGKTLKAILWTNFPVVKDPPTEELSYGVLIDVDADENTGVRGVDYVDEIKWKNNTWTKLFTELSSHGEVRILDEGIGHEEFIDDKKRFVTITVDLEAMGSPEQYKLAFFTHEIVNRTSNPKGVSDFSKWVHVPAPDFVISTQPSSGQIHAGEEATIEVTVESDSGFEPEVILSSPEEKLVLDFAPDRFTIPSHSLASTALKIQIPEDIPDRHYTFLIFANVTFPVESSELQILKNPYIDIPELEGETISKKSRFVVEVLPPIPFHEKVLDFFGRAEVLITFAITVGTVLNSVVLYFYKKGGKKDSKNDSKDSASKNNIDNSSYKKKI